MTAMCGFSHTKYLLMCHFTAALLAMYAIVHASEPSALNLVIIFRDDMPVHNRLVENMQKLLRSNKDILIRSMPVKSFNTSLNSSDFVLAIGDSALAAAMKFEEARGFFLLVTDSFWADQAVSTGRWQGVMARPPYGLQMKVMRDVLPHVSSLGLIYGPESRYEFNLLRQAASYAGINIKAKEVMEPSLSLQSIHPLFDSCHAVFMFPDARLLNNITMESMLLLQHEKKIPVIGISKASVVAGALMAVSYDLDILAQVTCDAINRYSISNVMPDETVFVKAVTVYYNASVAKRLGLQLNENRFGLQSVSIK